MKTHNSSNSATIRTNNETLYIYETNSLSTNIPLFSHFEDTSSNTFSARQQNESKFETWNETKFWCILQFIVTQHSNAQDWVSPFTYSNVGAQSQTNLLMNTSPFLSDACIINAVWHWRQQVFPGYWQISTTVHGITPQKTRIFSYHHKNLKFHCNSNFSFS